MNSDRFELRFSFFIIYFMFLTDIWPVISCVLLLLLLYNTVGEFPRSKYDICI